MMVIADDDVTALSEQIGLQDRLSRRRQLVKASYLSRSDVKLMDALLEERCWSDTLCVTVGHLVCDARPRCS